jgi:diacylglycerol kinase family enzyme
VILNTRSGAGHDGGGLDGLRKLFDEAGMNATIVPVHPDMDIVAAVRKAMEDGPRVVVAAGGDGTVSSVAHALRGSDIALGIVPLGTLNHFSRDLAIPDDPAAAVRVVADGHRVAIDVGDVNGATFVNNSSLGLYPGIVRRRERQQRRLRRSKRAAMTWAILAAMRHSPLLNLHVQLDDRETDVRSPFVFIGNNAYVMEGFEIGRRERLDGGLLSVYTTARSTVGGLFRLALRALFGCLRQSHDFAAVRARTMRIDSPHSSLLVATDGEVRAMQTPLEFSIVPRALNVIVPKTAEP